MCPRSVLVPREHANVPSHLWVLGLWVESTFRVLQCFYSLEAGRSSQPPRSKPARKLNRAIVVLESLRRFSEIRWWPPPLIYKAKIWTNIWTKYDPKCFKTRQIRQFGDHIFVHIFALYVGVGVAKRLPSFWNKHETQTRWRLRFSFVSSTAIELSSLNRRGPLSSVYVTPVSGIQTLISAILKSEKQHLP